MLIGLSAKNAILVVEYADQLFFEKNMDLKAATIEAARLRMRPIMMTAFSFILGVMPLIFASGVYATAREYYGYGSGGRYVARHDAGHFHLPCSVLSGCPCRQVRTQAGVKTKRVMKRYFAIILFAAALASCSETLRRAGRSA